MNFPQNLRYSAEHEWISLEGNLATIGITDHAQKELGDIVFVDVSSVGQDVNQNDIFGSIEAVKTVSDLFMPVAGKIVEFNQALEDNPELVNTDPYGKGWIVKAEISDLSQVDGLMESTAYSQLVGA